MIGGSRGLLAARYSQLFSALILLAEYPVVRLDQNNFLAAEVLQHADQLIVEAADFKNGHESFVLLQPVASQLLKEGKNPLWMSRYLPSQQDIPVLITE